MWKTWLNHFVNTSVDVYRREGAYKHRELKAGLLVSGVGLVLPALGAITAMVSFFFIGSIGFKEYERGRTHAWVAAVVFAVFAFLTGGTALSERICNGPSEDVAKQEACLEHKESISDYRRKMSGFLLMYFGLFAVWLSSLGLKAFTPTQPVRDLIGASMPQSELWPTRWREKEETFEKFALAEIVKTSIQEVQLYHWICQLEGSSPDQTLSHYKAQWESETLVHEWPYHLIYDLVEQVMNTMSLFEREGFCQRINGFLRDEGIGWQLGPAGWEHVGDEPSTEFHLLVASRAASAEIPGVEADLRGAWRKLKSDDPAEWASAVAQATRAVETVLQAVANAPGSTVTQILNRHLGTIDPRLRSAIKKFYSYSSQHARHGTTDREFAHGEAFICVVLANVIVSLFLPSESPSDC